MPIESAPIRLELPFSLERTSVNAYLCLDPEPTLIDTGDASDETWRALVAGMAAHGVAVGDLRRVIITHTHIDHFGQAARLVQESDARFLVMDAGFTWLTDFTRQWQTRFDYYRDVFLPATGLPVHERTGILRFSQHVLETYRSVPAARVDCLHDGVEIDLGGAPWTTLHVPGHASMLTAFYAADTRTLLSSDMLLARTPTPVFEPPATSAQWGRPLPSFVRSLARIAALDVATVLPGHGAPFHNAAKVIDYQQRRIATRKEECLGHVRAGVQTAFDLHQLMYPYPSPDVNMAELWMVVGYLDLLEEEGRIVRRTDGGLWLHTAV